MPILSVFASWWKCIDIVSRRNLLSSLTTLCSTKVSVLARMVFCEMANSLSDEDFIRLESFHKSSTWEDLEKLKKVALLLPSVAESGVRVVRNRLYEPYMT